MIAIGKKLIPHVVETSIGCDRTLFSIIDTSFEEGKDRGWGWLRLNENIAPYTYAVSHCKRTIS